MSIPTCKFFRSEQGCKFGNKCRYKHSDLPPFPSLQHPDHQGQHNNGSVRRGYSAETYNPQDHSTAVRPRENEVPVRNPRYTGNFSDRSHRRPASNHEDQLRISQPSHIADTHLEERFQKLGTIDHAERRVRSNFGASPQQHTQRKVCHYFIRHGNCCFGSRCRFEHAQPSREQPPRFQPVRGGPRYEKDGYHQTSVSLDDKGKEGEEVKYPRNPDEDFAKVASYKDPPEFGSAAQALESADDRQGNQNARADPSQGGCRSEGTRDGRNQTAQNIKPDKICQFFVRGWCWKGRRCRFLHPRKEAATSKKTEPEAEHEDPEEKVAHSSVQEQKEPEGFSPSPTPTGTESKYSATGNASPKPSKAQNSRTTYAAQGNKKYRRDEVDDVESSRLRRTEIDQLIKRFPKSKVKVVRDCAEYFQCIISFSPTDPDWPFDVKVFQLQADIPSDYPFEMLSITVPEEQDLPETVRRYLEVSIEEWLEEKERQLGNSGQVELVFRPFLRWLDRNIEDVVTEGLKQLKRELVAKASGLEFISAKQLQKQYPGQTSSRGNDEDDNESDEEDGDETESESQDDDTSSDYDDSEEEDNSEEEVEEDGNAEKKSRKTQQDRTKAMMVDPERRGTEVTLKNLQLKESAATLYFEKVCLLIQCERCKATSEFMASPGRINMVQCGQCSQTQTATYRPAMAHHFSSVVGYLDLDGCLPYDLILQNCHLVIACMSCTKDTKSGAVIAGQPQEQWCRVCHHKLKVATDGVRFTQLEPSKIPQSLKGLVKVVVPTRKRIPKDPAIQEGKPLPNFGTCKHYKKSYRWLRFPCCGKCYPCDVCHDSKEDHEMKFANRMICGFCCKEQPYAAERPCKGCDMNMTRVHTKHWEGGQGCRDKISMSRNDKHKYRNASKTTSKHSKKVKDMQSKKKTKLRHT